MLPLNNKMQVFCHNWFRFFFAFIRSVLLSLFFCAPTNKFVYLVLDGKFRGAAKRSAAQLHQMYMQTVSHSLALFMADFFAICFQLYEWNVTLPCVFYTYSYIR